MNILVFRSYGDLMILLNVLKQGAPSFPLRLKVSNHLRPLVDALPDFSLPSNVEISYFDIGIDKGILRLFTNRDFISFQTIKELVRLKKVTQSFSIIHVEQQVRAWVLSILYFPTRFVALNHTGNVYENYHRIFSIASSPHKSTNSERKKILIFPDSRKKSKQIPEWLLSKLINNASLQIIEAHFGNGTSNDKKIYYSNFESLVQCIQNAHFIISADSLPVHIAHYFSIPHYILYSNKVNKDWLTPYARTNQSYGLFKAHSNLEPYLKEA